MAGFAASVIEVIGPAVVSQITKIVPIQKERKKEEEMKHLTFVFVTKVADIYFLHERATMTGISMYATQSSTPPHFDQVFSLQ